MKLAITLLCLIILSSCSTSKPVSYTEQPIPQALLQPCTYPPFAGTTYGEVIEYSIELQRVIKECDAQIKGVKEVNSKM